MTTVSDVFTFPASAEDIPEAMRESFVKFFSYTGLNPVRAAIVVHDDYETALAARPWLEAFVETTMQGPVVIERRLLDSRVITLTECNAHAEFPIILTDNDKFVIVGSYYTK